MGNMPPHDISNTDPSWYPLVLNVLATHLPAYSKLVWQLAIYQNGQNVISRPVQSVPDEPS